MRVLELTFYGNSVSARLVALAVADSIIVIALLAQTALWVNHLVITWLARQAEARGADGSGRRGQARRQARLQRTG